MLWHYPDKRFVPHSLQGAAGDRDAQVLVTWQEPPHFDGVLVNLSTEVPDFFTRFQRVMEVVVGETRDQGRERYRFYSQIRLWGSIGFVLAVALLVGFARRLALLDDEDGTRAAGATAVMMKTMTSALNSQLTT